MVPGFNRPIFAQKAGDNVSGCAENSRVHIPGGGAAADEKWTSNTWGSDSRILWRTPGQPERHSAVFIYPPPV